MDEILKYENLVYSVANRFRNNFEFDDLVQVGDIGLIKAFKNYKPGFNTKFSTYAYTYILGEILLFIRSSKTLKVSKDLQKLYKTIEKMRNILSSKLNRMPTNQELAAFLEIDEEMLNEAIQANQFVRSLDYSLNSEDEEKDISLYDLVPYDEKNYNPEILDLKTELGMLPSDEQKLIKYRYFDDMSQNEVGKIMNTNQVNISRNETKILRKLREKLTT